MAYYEAHLAILPVRLSYPPPLPPPHKPTLQHVLSFFGGVCKQIQHSKATRHTRIVEWSSVEFEQVMLTQDTIHLQ